MEGSFDPYYKWLGIGAQDQPPNHYRLLGIDPFESDPEVIQATFNRQRMHVMTYRAGPHGSLAQQLLQEIAAARACLLDAAMKQAYDDELRGSGGAGDAPGEERFAAESAPHFPATTERRRASRGETRTKNTAEESDDKLWWGIGRQGQIKIVAGGMALVVLMCLYMLFGPSPSASKAKPAKPKQEQREMFPDLPKLKKK